MALRGIRGALPAVVLAATLAAGCGPQAAAREPGVVFEPAAPADAGGLPDQPLSIKFAVIGDSGRGTRAQHEVAAAMVRWREAFPFDFVLMVGDNIYEGPASPEDYRRKFEEPYRALLDAGVTFHAVLGNHDDPRQVGYAPFNMNGHRYYTFTPPGSLLTALDRRAQFFALDSTNLDAAQLRWLSRELERSEAVWKIVFLHHPLYTGGRYRNVSRFHRWYLERRLDAGGVDVVFSGHEHFYQRTTVIGGIQYFVTGAAGSLRPGEAAGAPFVARSFDEDYSFMLVEVTGDALHVRAIARDGSVVDAGVLRFENREP